MQNIERLTLTEMQEFVKGSGRIGLSAPRGAHGLIRRVLAGQQYPRLGKASKGIVRRFLRKVTGLAGRS